MFVFAKRAMQFDSQHVILSNATHAAGGFSLALLLQCYLTGGAFAPVWIGWFLLVCAIAEHLWAAVKHNVP